MKIAIQLGQLEGEGRSLGKRSVEETFDVSSIADNKSRSDCLHVSAKHITAGARAAKSSKFQSRALSGGATPSGSSSETQLQHEYTMAMTAPFNCLFNNKFLSLIR
jgi:hypothetical protein